jgi:cytoskeletal protein CcmA (bactofilin family)
MPGMPGEKRGGPTASDGSGRPGSASALWLLAAGGAATAPMRLTVGPGISLAGKIAACERLVVEGEVRVTLEAARAIEIATTGRFTGGKAEVEDAEVSGVYEGELTVRGRLLIRETGRVSGTVRYGAVEIERGGQLSGAVSRLEPAPAPER